MEWSSMFDEAHPDSGATADIIAEFVASIGQPMSAAEIREVNDSHAKLFPPGQSLHAAAQSFDSTCWVIPNRPLPPSYLSLLRWSNGGEFRTGERWFRFFPALHNRHGVRAMLLAYQIPKYMPEALPFAFDGGGTFYLFDMREESSNGEYPIAFSHAGNLGWEADECEMVADWLPSACRLRQ